MAKKAADVVGDPVLDASSDIKSVLPEEYRGRPGADLLGEACLIYGINPDPRARPIELPFNAWRFYPGDRADDQPDRVALATAGGLKLFHPPTDDTLTKLRQVFKLQRTNPKTGDIYFAPLPEDLTLPRSLIDGRVPTSAHVYKGGYLRSGGKAEADRREQATKAARDQMIAREQMT
jgi:hypothetical protein